MCICKILVKAQKFNYGETVPTKSHLKVSVGLQSLPLHVDLEMGVRVGLREVSAYGR